MLINLYLRPLWLELLVASYLLPIGAWINQMSLTENKLKELFIWPFITLLLCLFFVLGLPKFEITHWFFLILIPGFMAAACIVRLGYIILPANGDS